MAEEDNLQAQAEKYRVEGERLQQEGKYKEAMDCFLKALEITEKIKGSGHPDMAIRLHNVASLLKTTGRYAEADLVYRIALEIDEKAYAPDHKEVAISLKNLQAQAEGYRVEGERLQQEGRYKEAMDCFLKALEITKKIKGSGHPDMSIRLDNIAGLLKATGRYIEAESMYRRALEIYEKAYGSDDKKVAVALNNLAGLLDTMGRQSEAERMFRRALEITESASIPDHTNVAAMLNNLACLLNNTGQYAEAELMFRRALEIIEKIQDPEHSFVASYLNNLALVLSKTGRYAEAELMFRRVLEITEKIHDPDHSFVATYLDNLAFVLKEMGRYAEAEALCRRALKITEGASIPDIPAVAAMLNNLASVLIKTGQYAEAELMCRRALEIIEKVYDPDHPAVSKGLLTLADLLKTTGRYSDAVPMYRRALQIKEKAPNPDLLALATMFIDFSLLLYKMGHYEEAEPLCRKVLSITKKFHSPNHLEMAIWFNNLGLFLHNTGHYAEAEQMFMRALQIAEKAPYLNRPAVASCLCNLASLLIAMGRYMKAEPLFRRAMEIAESSGDPELLWHIQDGLAKLLKAQDRPDAAILMGKAAVNTIQGIRANVAGLGRDALQSHQVTVENVYKFLAELLMDADRLPEAEQVLNLLKEQEYFEYTRREGARSEGMSLTRREQPFYEHYRDTAGALLKLEREYQALLGKEGRSLEEDDRLSTLEALCQEANNKFHEAIDAIRGDWGEVPRSLEDDMDERLRKLEDSVGLQTELKELGRGAVALYTIATEKALRVLLIGPEHRMAFINEKIGERELRRKIVAFRQALQPDGDRFSDARDLGTELYDHLLGPVIGELEKMGARTLMWSLEGSMRYLPVAALYDGERYLAERFCTVLFTPASDSRLKDEPKPRWTGLGLGVTDAYKEFKPLEKAREELYSVIKTDQSPDGVLEGSVYLNEKFTWLAMREALKKLNPPLVHIATHFHMTPGNETTSYLLMGGGKEREVPLSWIKNSTTLFGGVELLTLSACNTAMGDVGQDGKEVECFGVLAQRQGAKAVVATLWPVADDSTSLFMQEFYKQRIQGVSKAEALRGAQLKLINRGAWKNQEPSFTEQGAGNTKRELYNYKREENAPFAHPYYWAPFILIGNWK